VSNERLDGQCLKSFSEELTPGAIGYLIFVDTLKLLFKGRFCGQKIPHENPASGYSPILSFRVSGSNALVQRGKTINKT
jgi:hypothetical protein